jgi:hypothetical protein
MWLEAILVTMPSACATMEDDLLAFLQDQVPIAMVGAEASDQEELKSMSASLTTALVQSLDAGKVPLMINNLAQSTGDSLYSIQIIDCLLERLGFDSGMVDMSSVLTRAASCAHGNVSQRKAAWKLVKTACALSKQRVLEEFSNLDESLKSKCLPWVASQDIF